jgi:cellulose 1,4-beta-cellobiosidase
MSLRRAWRLVGGLLVLTAIALIAVSASAATTAADRTPPTKPGNPRVTDKTTTTVTLAWNASTDNSGNFNYVVNRWQDPKKVTLPKTQTSYTWTGLLPNSLQYFWIEAVDAAGNKSTSDLVVVTLRADTTPPSTPGNLETDTVTASQVALSWDASTDDSGIREYLVSVTPNTGWNLIWTGPTAVTVVGLAPETAYTFTVKARDLGWNVSPASNAASATTEPTTDVTPPTAPTELRVSDRHNCEIMVRWIQSTDDQDPQAAIRYRLVDNGVPDPNFAFTIGTDRWTSYGFEGTNTWVLHAIDSAGNVSPPSNPVTLELFGSDCQ